MKLTTSSKIVSTVCAIAIIQLGQFAHAAETIPGVAMQPAAYFYTGKPYDNDLGEYTFAFRNYSPQVNRWTSADPSGFPDGANNRTYAPSPTSQLDPTGLFTLSSTSPNPSTATSGSHTVTANALQHISSTNLSFSGWTFVNGGSQTGTLSIDSYGAAANQTSAGAYINVSYSGTALNSFNWIQIITTNAPLGNNGNTYFDNGGNGQYPFYAGTSGGGNTPYLYDFSQRSYSSLTSQLTQINWEASLYLVNVNDFTSTITVYDGVKWGWSLE